MVNTLQIPKSGDISACVSIVPGPLLTFWEGPGYKATRAPEYRTSAIIQPICAPTMPMSLAPVRLIALLQGSFV